MRFLSRFILSLLLLLCLSCGNNDAPSTHPLKQWLQDNGKLKVLSTTCMVSDLVEKIGRDHIDNITLIGYQLDPHSYQLVKGDSEKLQFANVIFYSGLGLEHGPSLHQQLKSTPKAVAVADAVAEAFPDQILNYDGQVDPHIWMDISLWMQTIPQITKTLSEQDPAHAKMYRANAEELMREMKHAHKTAREILQQVPDQKRFLVTSHDAFNYFARAYMATKEEVENGDWNKRFQAPEGLAPESQLSSSDIQFILDHLMKYQIHVIFPETNVSRDSIRKIVEAARGNGLEVRIADVALYGDAMGKPGSGADSYLDMILTNAKILNDQLNGQSVE